VENSFSERAIVRTLAVLGSVVMFMTMAVPQTNAASPGAFSTTDAALISTYSAILTAQHNGANVSQLVAQLNSAVALYQKALTENSTNPSGAMLDLRNATQIASVVSAQAPTISQAGASSTQLRDAVSISSAVAVGVTAVLAYVFGGRIYRRVWFFLYKDYVVVSSKDG
jgi:hypothetical protein